MEKLEIGFRYDSGYESNVVINRKVPFNGTFVYEADNGLFYYSNGECLNHIGDNEAHLQLDDDDDDDGEIGEMETYQVFKTVTTVTEYYTKARNANQAEININDNNFHYTQLVSQTSEKKIKKFS